MRHAHRRNRLSEISKKLKTWRVRCVRGRGSGLDGNGCTRRVLTPVFFTPRPDEIKKKFDSENRHNINAFSNSVSLPTILLYFFIVLFYRTHDKYIYFLRVIYCFWHKLCPVYTSVGRIKRTNICIFWPSKYTGEFRKAVSSIGIYIIYCDLCYKRFVLILAGDRTPTIMIIILLVKAQECLIS